MTVSLKGAVRARIIQPDTPTRFAYVAGETIVQGEMLAKGESDGRVYQARASDSTRMPAIGCVVGPASAGAGETVYITPSSIIQNIRRTEDFGQDDQIYVSDTLGKVTKNVPAVVGNFVQIVGRSINASDIMLNVDQQMIRLDQV